MRNISEFENEFAFRNCDVGAFCSAIESFCSDNGAFNSAIGAKRCVNGAFNSDCGANYSDKGVQNADDGAFCSVIGAINSVIGAFCSDNAPFCSDMNVRNLADEFLIFLSNKAMCKGFLIMR